MPRILIVEDEPNMVRTLARILGRRGFEVSTASDGAEALARLEEQSVDLVVTDLKMPGMGGMELLTTMRGRGLLQPTIVLTGYGTVQTAVEAMKLGAADYLIKPCNPEELLLIVERQLETRRLRLENQQLRAEVRQQKRFGELVGASAPMLELYGTIEALGRNKSNVLLIGESGTGKELVARMIHDRSFVAERPFFAVNCAGMSETLIDSQLFGHKRGAFTGAVADHEGVFQAAAGGTLFLDEVFEIPLSLQAKFLRALQEREVTPLGSNRAVSIEVRIIAATHRDLEQEVREGRFRSDLYYRLNVVTLRLPPLRERKEDIAILVDHFAREFARVYRVDPKPLSPEALAILTRYDWPGNVRELMNAIERAFALARESEIDLNELPAVVRNASREPRAAQPESGVRRLDEMEEDLITRALAETDGNKNQAAKLLGIDRQRLYRKIEKYRLKK